MVKMLEDTGTKGTAVYLKKDLTVQTPTGPLTVPSGTCIRVTNYDKPGNKKNFLFSGYVSCLQTTKAELDVALSPATAGV